MKNFKAFLIFAFTLALFAAPPAKAQTRLVTTQVLNQGNFLDYGGIYPGTPIDSLQVSDSIAYLVQLSHTGTIWPYITWYWNKIGAGNATITLSFLQSNDGANWFAVKQGQAQTAYTKTYSALSASTQSEVDFRRDTALVSGRWLKVYYITSSTASVKGKLVGRLKTNIQ